MRDDFHLYLSRESRLSDDPCAVLCGVFQGYMFELGPRQTRYIHPSSGDCWSTVRDGGPTITQQWVDVCCWLGHGWTSQTARPCVWLISSCSCSPEMRWQIMWHFSWPPGHCRQPEYRLGMMTGRYKGPPLIWHSVAAGARSKSSRPGCAMLEFPGAILESSKRYILVMWFVKMTISANQMFEI